MKTVLIRLAVVAFCALASFLFIVCGLEIRANASDFEQAFDIYMVGTGLFAVGCATGLAGVAAAVTPFKAR